MSQVALRPPFVDDVHHRIVLKVVAVGAREYCSSNGLSSIPKRERVRVHTHLARRTSAGISITTIIASNPIPALYFCSCVM